MSNLEAISVVIQTYFDGLYEGDVGKLAGVFHEACHLQSLDAGEARVITRAQWLAAVEARPTPKSMRLTRTDRIAAIDLAGPEMALAKVECSIHPRYFTDYLVLLNTAGGWKIVSKTYRVDTRP